MFVCKRLGLRINYNSKKLFTKLNETKVNRYRINNYKEVKLVSEFFDKQFYKEFKSLMLEFRNETSLNVRNLPIPFKKPVLVEKLFVKGIEDDKYKILNNKFVIRRRKNTIKRYLYRNNGEIKGETNYTAKDGNVLVVTQDNLRLPFTYAPSDSRLEYVDFRTKEGVRTFIYSVPKEYLYRTQQTALVLCPYSKKSHFGGIQVTLTNGHTVYLYIVPLKSVRETEGNIPIVSKAGVDYSKEIQYLQVSWLKQGIIFPRRELELDTPVKEISNLGYRVFEPTIEYSGIDEFSLAERVDMQKRSAY